MKYFNSLKSLLVASCIGVTGMANAQQITHPLSFGTYPNSLNYYSNYVGIRFLVTAPSSIAGSMVFTTPNDSTGATGAWAGGATTMINKQVIIGPASDSNGCAAYPAGYFTGKIALIWRGTCEFGFKALQAQNAGAIAVVIVNNVAGGPVGMGAGAVGSSVTIPMFQIGLDDGTNILNQLNAGTTVTMSIVTHWGEGNYNDLGFVPSGYSISANNAMPYSQLTGAAVSAYQTKDGGFIANYGHNTETNVKLKSQLLWTPSEATSSTVVYTDSIVKTTPFPQADSIYAMYMAPHNLPNTPGPGMYTLNYTISSDSTDAFPADNTVSYNFYATDSLYSKGRYDFTNNKPFTPFYTGPGTPGPIIWTVPYYVATGGSYFDSVKFSVISTNTSGIIYRFPAGDNVTIYVFKWTDANGDSLMQNSELDLVGSGFKFFNGTTDSSWQTFTVGITRDSMDTATMAYPVKLQDNTTYVIGASVPKNYYLGCDGVIDGYPRSYGRHLDGINEYYNPIWGGDRYYSVNGSTPTNQEANPNAVLYPWSFDGTGSYNNDSVVFSTQKGLMPALSFTTTNHMTDGIKQAVSPLKKFELYPNPSTDVINASITLSSPASKVIYNVIDVSGRTISSETHTNVSSEVYTYNTSSLASGSYYLIAVVDGKISFKKFTVIR